MRVFIAVFFLIAAVGCDRSEVCKDFSVQVGIADEDHIYFSESKWDGTGRSEPRTLKLDQLEQYLAEARMRCGGKKIAVTVYVSGDPSFPGKQSELIAALEESENVFSISRGIEGL